MAIGWWVEAYAYVRAAMQKMVSASQGDTHTDADVTARMQQMISASSGWMDAQGATACVMQPMTSSAVGTYEIPASVAANMQKMTTAAQVDVVDVIMTSGVTMKQMLSAAAAAVAQSATAAASMKQMTTAVVGTESYIGTVAAVMKQMVSSSAGAQSQPVAYDTTGTTSAAGGPPTPSITINTGDSVIIWLEIQWSSTPTGACTVNGVNMPVLAGPVNCGNSVFLMAFGSLTPPTGTNLPIRFTGSVQNAGSYNSAAGVAYKNVVSFGTAVTATTGNITAQASAGERIAAGFASNGAFSAKSGSTLTNRFSIATAAFVNDALYAGDAAGTGSPTQDVGASCSSQCGAIAIPLKSS